MKKKIFKLVENNTFRINESANTYETAITIIDPETDEERDVEVVVEYEYIPAERGSRERGTGAQLEPDYPAHVEIYSVTDANDPKKEYDLTNRQQEQIENEILDDIADRAADYEADDYDRDYDPYDR